MNKKFIILFTMLSFFLTALPGCNPGKADSSDNSDNTAPHIAIAPASDTLYNSEIEISISTTLTDTTIYYTTDGSTPSELSTEYTGPFWIINNTVIKAIARDNSDFSILGSAEKTYQIKRGKFKVANSWGKGWQGDNNSDGFYWISYGAMKKNSFTVSFTEDKPDYSPLYLITFEIQHSKRKDCYITAYLSETPGGSFIAKKEFNNYFQADSGLYPFPGNVMVMDISETGFINNINSYDLFLNIYASSNDSGNAKLVSFSVEKFADGINNPATLVLSWSGTGNLSVGHNYFQINTAGQMGNPAAGIVTSKTPRVENLIAARSFSEKDMAELKMSQGVYEEGKNYNVIINGYGTGLQPLSESEYLELVNTARVPVALKSISRSTALPGSWDLSQTKYFPPVGHQGNKGTCCPFSWAYYVKTFQEAVDHDRDLSGITFSNPSGPSTKLNYIMSPDFIYPQINNGVDNGSSHRNAARVITGLGVASWQECPYIQANSPSANYTTFPSESAWREAPKYRSSIPDTSAWGIYYISANITTDEQINIIKTLLKNNIPVVIDVDASQFHKLSSDDEWRVDNYTDSIPNHANVIVGYDEL